MRTRLIFSLLLLVIAAEGSAAREVRAIAPKSGIPSGGTLIMIYGRDLVPPTLQCPVADRGWCPGVRVWFGNATAAFSFANSDYIYVYAPAGSGTADIRIEVEGLPDLTVRAAYTWDPFAPPRVGDSIRYLVPITAFEVPGANGSLWTSELLVYNPYGTTTLRGRLCHEASLALCAPGLDVEREVTRRVRIYPRIGAEGAFLYVPTGTSSEFVKQLRVRDISRDAENFGSEVPVVSTETDFAYRQRLVDVPTDPRYRTLLRIYAADDRSYPVIVRVFPASGREVIEQREIRLEGAAQASEFALNPAYAELDPITPAVRASGHARVRVEVEALSFPDPPPATRIWAFLSLTNNVTQQFTVITPQR